MRGAASIRWNPWRHSWVLCILQPITSALWQLVHEPLKRLWGKLLNCSSRWFFRPLQSSDWLEPCPLPSHGKVKEGHSLGNSKNGASVSREGRQECHDPVWVMSICFKTRQRQWGFVVSFGSSNAEEISQHIGHILHLRTQSVKIRWIISSLALWGNHYGFFSL